MHVAFVSPFEAQHGRGWSGTPTYMQRALARHVDRVSIVAPLDSGRKGRLRALRARLQGSPFMRHHTEGVARVLAQQAAEAVGRLRPDVVVGPSSLPFAFLDADVPVAFWTDLTFESALFLYDGYGGLPVDNLAEGHRVEAEALRRCHAFYASDYAARSATGYYGASPDRVAVVPFGANLDASPPESAVEASIVARPSDRCQLLFLGVDWVRKGGDVAVLVADHLNAMGLPTDLVVVGCTPDLDRPRPYVRARGYLSKQTPEGRAELENLLAASHFLILPVRAEAFGCVFCEASAYGLPSVTTTAGGSGSAVAEGENGLLFAPHPAPLEIAERLLALVRDRDAYRALARGSRDVYDRRLNWDAATRAVAARLARLAP